MLLMAVAFWAYTIAVALTARPAHDPRARARVGWGLPNASSREGGLMNWRSWSSEFWDMGGYGVVRVGLAMASHVRLRNAGRREAVMLALAARRRRDSQKKAARRAGRSPKHETARRKRPDAGLGGGVAWLVAAVTRWCSMPSSSNLVFFYTPTEVAAGRRRRQDLPPRRPGRARQALSATA
jgi:hypothetical protein